MIADLVPCNEIYGEIGVFKGELAKVLLDKLSPRELVLFDLFEGHMGSGNADGNFYNEVNLADEYVRLQTELPASVLFQKGDSSTNLHGFADNHFTMIYIDGDHSYEGCKKDLEAALHKVKVGGWIMGHDYQMNMEKARTRYHFGVKQAVDEFCVSHGLSIHALGMDGCVSYAIRVQKT
jgi:predicted O-methyltransferase YrrM